MYNVYVKKENRVWGRERQHVSHARRAVRTHATLQARVDSSFVTRLIFIFHFHSRRVEVESKRRTHAS